ncbi:RNA polymerase subunit sigma-24 [Shewanella hanedai]|uniref:DUF6596 domain-containing protein n=1 Tax=Shewanella hanedai TaxID=25 RepID=A0A553JV89_SHEHA|nr:DUF6596 domain-containing protein [Shewanella hanedai]TRY16369.1 hypothetical protein FN961_01745 [Shewanella hanedai]GGI68432.1 RNA polymerase subunit sigma-24 [Shewanella hanedai]
MVKLISEQLDKLVRQDKGRIMATLMGQFGDLARCEEAFQDAQALALRAWYKGIPDNARAWILKTARHRAIDTIRREHCFQGVVSDLSAQIDFDASVDNIADIEEIELPDERLKLMLICCHPALEEKTCVVMSLRFIAGLTTTEIGRGFLDKPATIGQRLSRAKNKIRLSGIRYGLPTHDQLAGRITVVLKVIYLIFNEGYVCQKGDEQLRFDLCEEALYLADLVSQLQPNHAEAQGLLALMQLCHARSAARQTGDGMFIPLEHQIRELWDRKVITEASRRLELALTLGEMGPYQLQAAIAAIHCQAPNYASTDWPQIVMMYRLLFKCQANDVVLLNLSVAESYIYGMEYALQKIEPLAESLSAYQPFHATRADFLSKLDRFDESIKAYEHALALTSVVSERRYLQQQKKGVLERKPKQ